MLSGTSGLIIFHRNRQNLSNIQILDIEPLSTAYREHNRQSLRTVQAGSKCLRTLEKEIAMASRVWSPHANSCAEQVGKLFFIQNWRFKGIRMFSGSFLWKKSARRFDNLGSSNRLGGRKIN